MKRMYTAAVKILRSMAKPLRGLWRWYFTPFDRRYRKLQAKMERLEEQAADIMAELGFSTNRIPLVSGERLRIVFWFQIPSFWVALDAFYESCVNDTRFEVTLVCHDEALDPSIKVEGSREYLEARGLPYVYYRDFDIDAVRPHVFVVQTPYDNNRPKRYAAPVLKAQGIRIAYFGYGVEFPDTEEARYAHFQHPFYNRAWRLYTFSHDLLPAYRHYCRNSKAVRAMGLPRFEAFRHSGRFVPDPEITAKAAGRPIVLWKVHFPKVIREKEKSHYVTPSYREYHKFIALMPNYRDFFFVFMPHPRFLEFHSQGPLHNQAKELLRDVSTLPDVHIDLGDDYRPSLYRADCIIIDRSTVMLEAGATGVPVLFMSPEKYTEPLSMAVSPLVDSYYKGSTCADMEKFLIMCRQGVDPLRHKRREAWEACFSLCDGYSADRIRNDIFDGLTAEDSAKGSRQTHHGLY
jgi:hypothetical protein